MKTIFLDFESIAKGKPVTNTAIVKITETKGETPAHIKEVIFKDAFNISYTQLVELFYNIENLVLDERAESETALTVGNNIPGIVKTEKGLNGFRSIVENMAKSLDKKGKLNENEKSDINKAFSLVERFLGPKK